jgi:hypothetical protein
MVLAGYTAGLFDGHRPKHLVFSIPVLMVGETAKALGFPGTGLTDPPIYRTERFGERTCW